MKGSGEGVDTLGLYKQREGNALSILGQCGVLQDVQSWRSGVGTESRAVLFLSSAPLERSLAPECPGALGDTLYLWFP